MHVCGYVDIVHAWLFVIQGYFDALRMELKSDRIDVQMVCPGPIVSNISSNAFSSQLDKVCVHTSFTLILLHFCMYV